MPEGHGPTVHIHPGRVELQITLHGERRRGEGLIDFEQVDVGDRQPRPREHPLDRLRGSHREPLGSERRPRMAEDSGHGDKTQGGGVILGHHDQRRPSIVTG